MSSTVGRGRRPVVFVALLVVASFAVALFAQQQPNQGPQVAAPGGADGTPNAVDAAAGPVAVGNGVSQGKSYKHDKTSKPLKDLPQVANKPKDRDEEDEHGEPRRPTEPRNVADGGLKNKSAETAALTTPDMPSANANFDGIPFPGVGCSCAPPDTNGEVGLTQYVQIVNEGTPGLQQVHRRLGARARSASPPCGTASAASARQRRRRPGRALRPAGQSLVRQPVRRRGYPHRRVHRGLDRLGRDRHLVPLRLPLGSNFFDYPHLWVWPDAYYMSMNVFNCAGTAFLGPQPFAFDRTAMLAGTAATFVTTGLTVDHDDATICPPTWTARRCRRPVRPTRSSFRTRRRSISTASRRLRDAGEHDLYAGRHAQSAGLRAGLHDDPGLRA